MTRDLRQVGYIGKNTQGKRVYDIDGVSATLTGRTAGLSGNGGGIYLISDSRPKGERNLTKTNEVNTEVNGSPFTYVSLFSGIGGFETALNKLGGTCVLASEIDRFANQSYEALYGHATAGDITKIEAADVPDHDVLVGGFPCQAFSVAGKRGGFDDARGTLFFEVARLAKTKQPRMLLLENVKGLISHDGGKTLDTIVQTLNDIGYHVDFNVLNSKYFGVPQNRERIFIVAIRDDIAKPSDWFVDGTNVISKGKRRIAEFEGVKTFNFEWPSQTEVTTRLRDILETEVDEKYYLSEEKTAALVAQLEERIGPIIIQLPRGNNKGGTHENAPTVTSNCYHGNNLLAEPQMVGHVDLNGNDICKRVYSTEGVAPTIPTGTSGNTTPKVAVGGLPIREATKQGYAIATEGDAVNFQFPDSKTRRGRVGKQIANTLEASSINQGVVMPKYRIRKLTPKECFRLQGFTDMQHDKLAGEGLSDSQRYKQAGNAVTVNVIHAIGERLLPYLGKEKDAD